MFVLGIVALGSLIFALHSFLEHLIQERTMATIEMLKVAYRNAQPNLTDEEVNILAGEFYTSLSGASMHETEKLSKLKSRKDWQNLYQLDFLTLRKTIEEDDELLHFSQAFQ